MTTLVQLGWRDPRYGINDGWVSPVEILRTTHMKKAIAHLGIEIGGKEARRHAFRLSRLIKHLAAQAKKRGEHLEIHSTNQISAPSPWNRHHGLGLEVRGISGRRIMWDVNVFSNMGRSISWRWVGTVINDGATRSAANSAHLIRQAVRMSEEVTKLLGGTIRDVESIRMAEERILQK